MVLPREGFTIDVAADLARRALLNPFVNCSIAIALSSKPVMKGLLSRLPIPSVIEPRSLVGAAYFLTLAGLMLSANDYLNRQLANNWVSHRPYDWNKEIVVVTGGSTGIGASIAQNFLLRNRRTRIVIIDIAPLSWKPEADDPVSFYQCDLTDSQAVRDTFARIREEVGDPTVLFNNAGMIRGATILDGSYAEAEITVRTNLLAPIWVLKEVLPAMVRDDHGHIVHSGSLACITPPALIADYAATKAGLVSLHQGLQLELKNIHRAPRVRLTMALLAFVDTPLIKGHPGVPNFLLPFLHVDSVGERLVQAVYSGYGSTIFMPGINRFLSMLLGGPEWLLHLARHATAFYKIDYRGRQALDEKTGKLVI